MRSSRARHKAQARRPPPSSLFNSQLHNIEILTCDAFKNKTLRWQAYVLISLVLLISCQDHCGPAARLAPLTIETAYSTYPQSLPHALRSHKYTSKPFRRVKSRSWDRTPSTVTILVKARSRTPEDAPAEQEPMSMPTCASS